MHLYQKFHGSNTLPYPSAGWLHPRASRYYSNCIFKTYGPQRVWCLVEEHESTAHLQHQELRAADPQRLDARESHVSTPGVFITDNTAQPTTGNELSHNAEDPEQPTSNSGLSGQHAAPCSFYLEHPRHPVPVQLPPSGASSKPAELKPFFVRAAYRPPAFLRHYSGAKDGAPYNFLSFLGSADPNGGKYIVPQQRVEAFLESYFNTMHHLQRRMHIAECYNDHPYKYFQELDLPWDLDITVVLSLIPRVIQIVTEEACRIHNHTGPLPTAVVSMRTPYKVHLNYPNIITVEAVASSMTRKAVINRCRAELSGQPKLELLRDEQQLLEQLQEAHHLLKQLSVVVQQLEDAGYVMNTAVQQLMQEYEAEQDTLQQLQRQDQPIGAASSSRTRVSSAAHGITSVAAAAVPGAADLDWESIIDFPHGSLRLLGSCKAPWMESDPEWVQEKCYSQVEYVDGVWMRQPLKLATVQQCSIQLTAMEQMLYEQSDDFLEASYQCVKMRQQLLSTKSVLRRASRCLTLLKSLQAALQENNQDAAAALAAQAYKSYMLMDPDHRAQQADGQPTKKQQKAMSKQSARAGEAAAAAQRNTQQHDQQRRKKQALEKLNKLQAVGVGGSSAAAAEQRPNLVRPLTSQQSTPQQ